MPNVKFGDTVLIRDGSLLDGEIGIVFKIQADDPVFVLMGKEVLWPVKLENLELLSENSFKQTSRQCESDFEPRPD